MLELHTRGLFVSFNFVSLLRRDYYPNAVVSISELMS